MNSISLPSRSAASSRQRRLLRLLLITLAVFGAGVLLYWNQEVLIFRPGRLAPDHRFTVPDVVERTVDGLRLHVECGSGTYVRSLVRDLGERLGCGAHVTALRRLWVEPFAAPAMTDLDALRTLAEDGADALDALLLPLEAGLAGYPTIEVDEAAASRLRQGQAADAGIIGSGRFVAVDREGRAVALVENGQDGRLRSQRGFNPVQRSPSA